jgi:hypothetical protein
MKRAKRINEGRPSKYKEEYCEMLIAHLTKGFSYETFAAIVNVDRDTIYEWETAHPKFSDAKRLGVSKAHYFWENIGLHGTTGQIPGFNVTCWIFNMKNRFKWHDNIKVENVADPLDKTKDNVIEKLIND